MKWICRILATYFLVLALMPCSDVYAADSSDLICTLTVDHQSCPHEHGPDFCSPLCNCSNCSQANFVLTNLVIQASKINDAVNEPTLPFQTQPHWLSALLNRYFHPPRV